MIFSQYRDSVEEICAFLSALSSRTKDGKELIRPLMFVGQGGSSDGSGTDLRCGLLTTCGNKRCFANHCVLTMTVMCVLLPASSSIDVVEFIHHGALSYTY